MVRTLAIAMASALIGLAAFGSDSAQAGSTKFKQIGTSTNPAGPIDNFDIGFVDQKTQILYLADRSNKSIDIFDAKTGKFIAAVGGFVGVVLKDGKPNNDKSGPDGVLAFGNEAWAGDGDSTIKVIDLRTRKIVDTIKTGGGTRVDEMAYDPKDGILIGVNNAEEPPFATLVSTKPGHKILGKVEFPDATDGAEQPAYNPSDGMFYVAIPELKKDEKQGGVAVIDPRKGKLVKMLPVDGCHPNGLVFGTNGDFALGCTANGKGMPAVIVIMNAKTGKVTKRVPDIGGADMVAYNPKLGQYYSASRSLPSPVLGVIDAKTGTLVQAIAVKGGNPHSVAVNNANNHVFGPVGSAGGGCGCVVIYGPEK